MDRLMGPGGIQGCGRVEGGAIGHADRMTSDHAGSTGWPPGSNTRGVVNRLRGAGLRASIDRQGRLMLVPPMDEPEDVSPIVLPMGG